MVKFEQNLGLTGGKLDTRFRAPLKEPVAQLVEQLTFNQ